MRVGYTPQQPPFALWTTGTSWPRTHFQGPRTPCFLLGHEPTFKNAGQGRHELGACATAWHRRGARVDDHQAVEHGPEDAEPRGADGEAAAAGLAVCSSAAARQRHDRDCVARGFVARERCWRSRPQRRAAVTLVSAGKRCRGGFRAGALLPAGGCGQEADRRRDEDAGAEAVAEPAGPAALEGLLRHGRQG